MRWILGFANSMANAYNTNDPSKWLDLKHRESRAMLEILRAFNHELSLTMPGHFASVVKLTVMGQLDVKKLLFVYREGEGFEVACAASWKGIEHIVFEELKEISSLTYVPEETQFNHLRAMGVEYVIPIKFKYEWREGHIQPSPYGAWFLVADFFDTEVERDNDLIFIETAGNILSVSIENRHLLAEMRTRQQLQAELEVAERVQQHLLPMHLQHVRYLDVASFHLAHHNIGGDYFDLIELDDHRVLFCIADVSGKGIGPALLMSNLQARLHALSELSLDLDEIMIRLNDKLQVITRGEQFITVFMGILNRETGEFRYVNAGHNPMILVQEGGERLLTEGTYPVGILPMQRENIHLGTAVMQPDDTLVLYTDGLSEQTGDEGRMWGEEGILQAIDTSAVSAQEVLQGIRSGWEIFRNDHAIVDDVTLMVIRRKF